MIGAKGVGKTSIVQRYTENKYTGETESTMGAQFSSKIVDLVLRSKPAAADDSDGVVV